ncbi:CHASE2 domain-containing protein [Candidatus Gracilibacteria bacterium]|nr:CHASE2 domain-containing protein [Candidatus Gracilibacteria bacterium]
MWNNLKKIAWNWRGVVFTVPSATGLIIAIRLIGWLQPLEWTTLDLFFRLRPLEPRDERIVIVGMEEKDIQKLKQWPISDRDLARLITKIKEQKPRVIGLDIYRDIPVEPGHEELLEVFKTTPNLIGIEKVIGDQFYSTINPPPVLEKLGQVSSSDIILDGDGVLRRAFLFPMAPGKENLPSLGLAVALKYLEKDNTVPVASDDGGWMKLKKTVFYPFNSNDGGYRNADAGGYQILLNYRGSAQSFQKISFTDVLEGHFDPNLMRDRIILVGSQATSIKDYFSTPHSQSLSITPALTFGVEIQANLASQILSTVLNNRPLIKVLPDYLEDLWIALWVVIPAIWAWKWRKTKNLLKLGVAIVIGTSVTIVLLIGISYIAFLNSWWLPLAPTLLALGCSSVLVTNFVYISQLQEYNLYLEHEVESRIQDLRKTYRELRAAQDKILVKEKLAALGTLVAGVSHELKNPLHFIQNFASLSVNLANELRETIRDRDRCCEVEVFENIHEISSNLSENLVEIKDHSKRANAIVQTMLPHPDGVASDRTPTDINALLDSTIKLVLYSQQGKYTNFPINLEKNYDRSIPQIEIFDRELSRSLINILDNAYYAVYQKAQLIDSNFRPLILVETENLKESVKIVIQDNGAGIPEDIIGKIFRSFFYYQATKRRYGIGSINAHDLIVIKIAARSN